MRRKLIQWAANFYPAAWRKRYGQEFAALMEDMPAPGWAAVWDVWKGAIATQIKNNSSIPKLAAIFGLVGLALAWGASLHISDIYVSESVLQATNLEAKSIDQSVRQVLSRSSLITLIEKHDLYAAERLRLPLEDLIVKMQKDIQVTAPVGNDPAKHAFKVAFAHEDRALAQRVTGDLVEALIKEPLSKGSLTVLDSVSSPEPIYPNRPVLAFIGLLAGGLVGAVFAAMKTKMAPIARS